MCAMRIVCSLQAYRHCTSVFRPPDIICRRTYFLPGILSFFFLSFFIRHLISELAEPNSTKIGHMVRSKCSLKTHVPNLSYLFSLQIGGPKTTFFGRPRYLTATLTAHIFGKKRDIDTWLRALTTTRSLIYCRKMT